MCVLLLAQQIAVAEGFPHLRVAILVCHKKEEADQVGLLTGLDALHLNLLPETIVEGTLVSTVEFNRL